MLALSVAEGRSQALHTVATRGKRSDEGARTGRCADSRCKHAEDLQKTYVMRS